MFDLSSRYPALDRPFRPGRPPDGQSRKELAAARASEGQTALDRLNDVFDAQAPGAPSLR
jgi:hypothetical protein